MRRPDKPAATKPVTLETWLVNSPSSRNLLDPCSGIGSRPGVVPNLLDPCSGIGSRPGVVPNLLSNSEMWCVMLVFQAEL